MVTSFAYRVWEKKLHNLGFKKNRSFNLLDIGCGAGYFGRYITKKHPSCQVIGGDIDEERIKLASGNAPGVHFLICDGHFLPFPDASYDVVTCFQVIEHLKCVADFVNEVNRVLKKNGIFIITTPNPCGVPAKLQGSGWPGHRFDHVSLNTPVQWKKIIGGAGFKKIDDGSTAWSGIKILRPMPFAFLNWIPNALFGYFHWYHGGTYVAIFSKI
ncbi:class I SAM-dependent methyltransferase [candidate division CSSED10-310 bacterium]|uniref:Class I SAM-dependent methyltransferase n=1 Tax=candidate division CSSED10-310 bacterium TaxID=2855610 RepID=A0ABV6YVL2_UNCC1